MPSSSSRSSFTARRFRRSARSSSLLGSVATIEDVMTLFIATERAYVSRLNAAVDHVAAAGASTELQPITDRLRKIRAFHEDLVLPMLRSAGAHAIERFFDEHRLELAAIYRSFLAVEVPASVVGLVVQLRPSLRVVDEQLAAYGLLFAALHRVPSAGRRVAVESSSSQSAGRRVEVVSASSESAILRVEGIFASSEPEFPRFGCRLRMRLKQRGFLRAVKLHPYRNEAHRTAAPQVPYPFGKFYNLRQPWEAITHAQCEEDLRMKVPQILKVEDTCTYVMIGFGWNSLGPDGIDMLKRASAENPGNPLWTAANRRITGTLLELIQSPTPISVRAFYEAARSDNGERPGANPRVVMQRLLQALRKEDRDRFTVEIHRAVVCPHCGWHESVSHAPGQLCFDYHRGDYNYTQPWAEMCGLPFDGFGPAIARAPPRDDVRCKGPGCGQPLRSTRPDGTLDLKEKLGRVRIGEPDKPQYVVMFYECPPEIVENGVKKVDVAAMKEKMRVRPHLEQRFGAFRLIPKPKKTRAPTVFNTDNQQVFHLIGYAAIIPRTFDHVAWRAHNLETGRFNHCEQNLKYFRVGRQDYLRSRQQISFAIYKSTGESVSDQPRQHEDKWEARGYRTHNEHVRGEQEGLRRMTTRSRKPTTAQGPDAPGPSGMQQHASTVQDGEQPGPSGMQQRAQKKTARKSGNE